MCKYESFLCKYTKYTSFAKRLVKVMYDVMMLLQKHIW